MCLSVVGVAYILGILLVACIIWLRQIPYHVHVGLQVEVHVVNVKRNVNIILSTPLRAFQG